jgi:hypothetical protein
VHNWPLTSTGGQYAADSHWLISDNGTRSGVRQAWAPLPPFWPRPPQELGPTPGTVYVNSNPWGNNGTTGISDDVPTKKGGVGEAWSTGAHFASVFAFSPLEVPQPVPTLELAYLIIPNNSIATYKFFVDDNSNFSTLYDFSGTFGSAGLNAVAQVVSQAEVVPEPAAIALLGGAGLYLLGMRRRRRCFAMSSGIRRVPTP